MAKICLQGMQKLCISFKKDMLTVCGKECCPTFGSLGVMFYASKSISVTNMKRGQSHQISKVISSRYLSVAVMPKSEK